MQLQTLKRLRYRQILVTIEAYYRKEQHMVKQMDQAKQCSFDMKAFSPVKALFQDMMKKPREKMSEQKI